MQQFDFWKIYILWQLVGTYDIPRRFLSVVPPHPGREHGVNDVDHSSPDGEVSLDDVGVVDHDPAVWEPHIDSLTLKGCQGLSATSTEQTSWTLGAWEQGGRQMDIERL